ncbi:MAG: lysyl oxidase 3-like, partial [Parcubacteria group bacterium Gr01-1014_48]
YALYTLQPVAANGAADRIGYKTTFCIMDTTRIKTKLPNAPKRAVYKTCDATVQGMSVGWGDWYRYSLGGQSIDITGLENGDYNLKIEIDPKSLILESNENDNLSTVKIRITDGTVTVL